MPRLIWSRPSILDLQRLRRFLAHKDKDAANRAASAIRQGVKVLYLQPEMGRPVDDLDDDFRDWIIDFGDSGYVVRYRLDAQQITILAVKHQREVAF